jgi:hypothetical protein
MPRFLGTRTSSRQPNGTPATRGLSRDFAQQDKGSTNQLTASLTFTAATARMAGGNGTFAAFGIGDRFLVEGTVTNDGRFGVTGIDAVNQAYLTVAPAPKDQGAISATLRKVIS